MGQIIDINQGEIKVKFEEPTAGKLTFADLGLRDEEMVIDGGFMRLVFDFEGIGAHHYFHTPTVEVAYKENMAETHWQCDFNETQILDKKDHHGHSTVILLNRNKLEAAEHHHKNKLIVHAEFPEAAHILAKDSYVHIFK